MPDKKYSIDKIKLIIGLGNPGTKYFKTRHNIGFRIADKLAENYSALWSEFDLMHSTNIQVSDDENIRVVTLVKPMTFMNETGKILPVFQKKCVRPEEILIIHDELEKPFGNVAIRFDGSHRGHNGLRSIMSFIGKDFWRLRFGIDRPEARGDVSGYVLSFFTIEQERQIDGLIDKAIGLIESK